jgi:2-dehydro-3-deoxygluconokinase
MGWEAATMIEEAEQTAREDRLDIVALGESLVEFFAEEPMATARTFTKAIGGDTFNLCCAAARIGGRSGYVTRVGRDPFAEYLLGGWRAAGVDTARIPVVEGFNGVYFISNFGDGQREFTYYRAGSAASQITPADLDPAYIGGCRYFFVSGISQAISPSARRTVRAAVELARAGGARVAFDPNLRLKLWSLAEARAALDEVLPFVDVLLPSAPEESETLLGLTEPAAVIEYFWRAGVPTVAVKYGAAGCVVGSAGRITAVPGYRIERVVDTTGAGDAFDAGFLVGLARGRDPVAAARMGVVLAGLKCRGRGATASLPAREEFEQVLAEVEARAAGSA